MLKVFLISNREDSFWSEINLDPFSKSGQKHSVDKPGQSPGTQSRVPASHFPNSVDHLMCPLEDKKVCWPVKDSVN